MADFGKLSRTELNEKLEEVEFYPELKEYLDSYLPQYIQSKDIDMVNKILTAGASPDADEDLNDYLLHLLHEYEVEKTTKGDLVLSIMESLLKHGANPNRVAMNNLRAYDYARDERIIKLFEKHGADPEPREPI